MTTTTAPAEVTTTATEAPAFTQGTVNQDTLTAYRAADAKGKAAIRTATEKAAAAALGSMRFQEALDLNATRQALTTEAPSKAPADYATEIAQHARDLIAAGEALLDGVALPKGITSEMVAASPGFEGDLWEVEVTASVAGSQRIATAKITRSAERNSIEAAMERAFEGLEVGTFLTCQEIANRGAVGDYRPSSGAVSARLFPRKGEVTLSEAFAPDYNEKGTKGATLTEEV